MLLKKGLGPSFHNQFHSFKSAFLGLKIRQQPITENPLAISFCKPVFAKTQHSGNIDYGAVAEKRYRLSGKRFTWA